MSSDPALGGERRLPTYLADIICRADGEPFNRPTTDQRVYLATDVDALRVEAEQREADALHQLGKVGAEVIRLQMALADSEATCARLREERDRAQRDADALERCVKDWLVANAPGGWIHQLRTELAQRLRMSSERTAGKDGQ